MSAGLSLLAVLGRLIDGLVGALPYALSYIAGRRGLRVSQLQRDERRRHGQLQIHHPGDNAVLNRLRDAGF